MHRIEETTSKMLMVLRLPLAFLIVAGHWIVLSMLRYIIGKSILPEVSQLEDLMIYLGMFFRLF